VQQHPGGVQDLVDAVEVSGGAFDPVREDVVGIRDRGSGCGRGANLVQRVDQRALD